MRLWWEVAKRGFSQHATYRAATFAGVFTNTVFGFIKAYVLLAVLRQRGVVGGFDAIDVVTFTFVTQGLLMPTGAFGWTAIADRIRTGDVVTDLYRPLDFQLYWLAQDLGRAAFHLLARGIPPVLVGALVFELRLPASAGVWLGFAVAVALAVVISFGVRFLVNLTAFWLLEVRGTLQLVTVVWMFLSGVIVPIGFFPSWLETLARALPFAAMIQLPVEVFLGKHPGFEVLGVLAYQTIWAGAVLMAGRALLAAATRRVVVQGG